MKSLYKEFLDGNGKAVWQEIYHLEERAFEQEYFEDVQAVLHETMLRSKLNLDLLYNRLIESGYEFQDQEEARLLPNLSTLIELETLKQYVKPYGFLPLSICEFYKVVGSVDFKWSWEIKPYFPFNQAYADAIVIPKLEYVSSMADSRFEDYVDTSEYRIGVEEVEEKMGIILSPDALMKENISGDCYTIQVTKRPSVDAEFPIGEIVDDPTNFVEYLRLCFEWCGFPGLANTEFDLPSFMKQWKKDLKEI